MKIYKWLFNVIVLLVLFNNCSKSELSKRKNFVVIQKPYEHVYYDIAPEPIEKPIDDQTNKLCPLPYMSSSRKTGCRCIYTFYQLFLFRHKIKFFILNMKR